MEILQLAPYTQIPDVIFNRFDITTKYSPSYRYNGILVILVLPINLFGGVFHHYTMIAGSVTNTPDFQSISYPSQRGTWFNSRVNNYLRQSAIYV